MCHLFCHNELPTVLWLLPVISAGIGIVSAKVRYWLRRKPGKR